MYESCSYFKLLCPCLDIKTRSLNQFSPRESYWEFEPAVGGQHSTDSGDFVSFCLTVLYGHFLKLHRSLLTRYGSCFCFYGFSVFVNVCISAAV